MLFTIFVKSLNLSSHQFELQIGIMVQSVVILKMMTFHIETVSRCLIFCNGCQGWLQT